MLPVHLWNDTVFACIVEGFGEVVEFDNSTLTEKASRRIKIRVTGYQILATLVFKWWKVAYAITITVKFDRRWWCPKVVSQWRCEVRGNSATLKHPSLFRQSYVAAFPSQQGNREASEGDSPNMEASIRKDGEIEGQKESNGSLDAVYSQVNTVSQKEILEDCLGRREARLGGLSHEQRQNRWAKVLTYRRGPRRFFSKRFDKVSPRIPLEDGPIFKRAQSTDFGFRRSQPRQTQKEGTHRFSVLGQMENSDSPQNGEAFSDEALLSEESRRKRRNT